MLSVIHKQILSLALLQPRPVWLGGYSYTSYCDQEIVFCRILLLFGSLSRHAYGLCSDVK